MTIDYQLERADFLAFAKERRQFSADSLSRLYYFVILPVLGAGLAIATQSFTTAAVFMALFVSSGWFVQNRIRRAHTRNTYSDENLSFYTRTKWTATLTDEGLRISSEGVDALYRWAFIQKVFKSSRYVCFQIAPIQTMHIPIRSFRDDKHLQGFIDTAQSCVKNPAHGK